MKPSFLLFSVTVSILIIITPVITEYYENWDYGDYEDWIYGSYEDRDSGNYGKWNWQYWWDWEGWQWWNQLWKQAGITKIIGDRVVPLTQLKLQLPNKKFVQPGEKISGADTFLIPPNVQWACENNKIYTLVMFDMDAPLAKDGNQVLIWRVDGIRGCGGVKSGTVTYTYRTGPLVLPGTGTHRLVVLVIQTTRPYGVTLDTEIKSTAERVDFSCAQLISENWPGGGVVAGTFYKQSNPIAGNIDALSVAPDVFPLL